MSGARVSSASKVRLLSSRVRVSSLDRCALVDPNRVIYLAVAAFKEKYLGTQTDFIESETLSPPSRGGSREAADRHTSFVRLSNLATFLHLVQSSAPDPTTRRRSPESARDLLDASIQLRKSVVTSEVEVDERLLRLVVDLKRQVKSSTPPDSSSLAHFAVALVGLPVCRGESAKSFHQQVLLGPSQFPLALGVRCSTRRHSQVQ
jgi:hypothetical protein